MWNITIYIVINYVNTIQFYFVNHDLLEYIKRDKIEQGATLFYIILLPTKVYSNKCLLNLRKFILVHMI